jgi:hypothetical protein
VSVTLYDLRCEARLLAARIEAAETTARHCRGLAALTPDDSVAANAIEHATLAERAALRMASRLSAITRSLPDA